MAVLDDDSIRYKDGVLTFWNGSKHEVFHSEGTFTPTLGNMAIGTGGGALNTASWTYTGGLLEVEGKVLFGTTAPTLPGASQETIALPPGFTLLNADTLTSLVCVVDLRSVGGGTLFKGSVYPASSTVLNLFWTQVSGTGLINAALAATAPFTWAAGDFIAYRYLCRATL